MTGQTWNSPAERRLFVRALARFSDECELPDLTPACPFYVNPDSGAVCAEECRDALEENFGDLSSPSGADLGQGIVAVRRPRPRRGPPNDQKSFDVRKQLLSDEQRPLSDWYVTSLLRKLRDRVMFPTSVEEGAGTQAIANELIRRGLEVDRLIRFAWSPSIVGTVMVQLVGDFPEELIAGETQSAWRSLWHAFETESKGSGQATIDTQSSIDYRHTSIKVESLVESGFLLALASWTKRASSAQLLSGEVPTVRDLIQPANTSDESDGLEEVWIHDRFTETYLEEWNESSLMCEWRYQHSLRPGCLPAAAMRERHIDSADLARSIANRRCAQWEDETGPDAVSQSPLAVWNFTEVALANLRAGKRKDAVAIYRALVQLRPDDPEVHNNLAFCLLPDDPQEAVTSFERSIELSGKGGLAMNHLNLALAYHRVERNDDALIELTKARTMDSLASSAMMWAIVDTVRVDSISNLAEYAIELEDQIALSNARTWGVVTND